MIVYLSVVNNTSMGKYGYVLYSTLNAVDAGM
jgi:hypothetical protein